MEDMDAWGYTFRLASARAWFESDAEDALAFLFERGLIERVSSIEPCIGISGSLFRVSISSF
jgi:hypothetical protein